MGIGREIPFLSNNFFYFIWNSPQLFTMYCLFDISLKKIVGGGGGGIPFFVKNNLLFYIELDIIIYNTLLILIFNNGDIDCKGTWYYFKMFLWNWGARSEIPFSIENNILFYMELAPIIYNIFNHGDCKAIISVWFITGYVIE